MTTQETKISFTDYVKANTDQDQFKIIDDVGYIEVQCYPLYI